MARTAVAKRTTKSEKRIEYIKKVLRDFHPMTVRQVYYRLVAAQIIDNNRSSYKAVSNLLVDLRLDGTIQWDYVEDRLRRPRRVGMWQDMKSFMRTVRNAYWRDIWADQPYKVEVWLEKDALSGIVGDVCDEFRCTLNVGRGYDGWSSIHNAALRHGNGDDSIILYLGDHDPSGQDMSRSLEERLNELGCYPKIIRIGLNQEDIEEYNLPPDLTKTTDSRRAKFVAEYGDEAVELDALPPTVLQERVRQNIDQWIDHTLFEAQKAIEKREEAYINQLVDDMGTIELAEEENDDDE